MRREFALELIRQVTNKHTYSTTRGLLRRASLPDINQGLLAIGQVPTGCRHLPAQINPTPLPTRIAGLFHHEGSAACDAPRRFAVVSNLDLIASCCWRVYWRMKFSFTFLLCPVSWLRAPLPHNDSNANTRFTFSTRQKQETLPSPWKPESPGH